MELRDYQRRAVAEIHANFKAGDRAVILSMPTGTGKTIVARALVDLTLRAGNRVLFTAPRRILVDQAAEKFSIHPAKIMGGETYDPGNPVAVATLQALQRRDDVPAPDLIIVDEAHWAHGSELVDSVMARFPSAHVIGLSATPFQWYSDDYYILDGYESVVEPISLADAIAQGYLVRPTCLAGVRPALDGVEITAGEYNQKQATDRTARADVMANIVAQWMANANGRKTLAYATSIAHAGLLAETFGSRARVVHSKQSEDTNAETLADFRAGKIDVIVNVDMLTTGLDIPEVDCLVLARPTKSPVLYRQIVGRGLRPADGKTDCLILDCACVFDDQGLPTETRPYEFRPKFSKAVDRQLGLKNTGRRQAEEWRPERIAYLKRVSSLLDLYDGKHYRREQELLEDCKRFLKRAGIFYWRQNSGVMNQGDRWVHFTDVKGLPDLTVLFAGQLYIGIELKLPGRPLNANQRATLPKMIAKGAHIYFAESVADLFGVLEHFSKNTHNDGGSLTVSSDVYKLPARQRELRNRLKIMEGVG